MMKLKFARIIAAFSIAIGIMVMIGWYLDITILTSVMPNWIRMKVATAACFIFSGIIVFALTSPNEKRLVMRQVVLVAFPTLLILVMGTLFLGSVMGFQTGMENITFIDVHEIQTPIFQGRPSVATMTAFILIALLGYLFNLNKATKRVFSIVGSVVGMIGTIGVVGYLIRMPVLYYEIAGISNAIAIHTTILFALLGYALYLIGSGREELTYEK